MDYTQVRVWAAERREKLFVLVSVVLLVGMAGGALVVSAQSPGGVSYTEVWNGTGHTSAIAWDTVDDVGFYANGTAGQTVVAVEGSTGNVVGSAVIGSRPEDAVYSTGADAVFVGGSAGDVHRVADDGTVEWSVSPAGGDEEVLMAYDPVGGVVWAAANDLQVGASTGTVYKLDAGNGSVLDTVSLSTLSQDAAYDVDNNRLLVAGRSKVQAVSDGGSVSVFDPVDATNIEVTESRVYVLNQSSGNVVAFEKAGNVVFTRTDATTLDIAGTGAHQASDTLFYTNSTAMVVVNSSGGVLGTVSTGDFDGDIVAFTENTGTIGVFAWDLDQNLVAAYSTNASANESGVVIAENESLTLDVRYYMQPNSTYPLSVYHHPTNYTRNEVTNQSTISIENVTFDGADVITYNNTSQTVSTINNSTVAERVNITATYDTGNGTVNDTQQVVVAAPTVDNLAILPNGLIRTLAVLTDGTLQALLVAALLSVPAARFTNAFAGLAVAEVVVVIGWLAGYTTLGIAMLSVFMAMFVGLNLAANIDYAISRGT